MSGPFIDPATLPGGLSGCLQLAELFAGYSYVLYLGCCMISDGAELLMLTPYAKLVGSVVLPVLGAVPDGAIVLFSGLGPNAQNSLDVGVGALAGSTVMLLTIPWCLSIYGGRVNLDKGEPKYSVPRGQPRLSAGRLWKSGVSVGPGARSIKTMASWMLATAVPYLVINVAAMVAAARNGKIRTRNATIDDEDARNMALTESTPALVALLMALLLFGAYLKFQYDAAYGPVESDLLLELQRAAAVAAVGQGTSGIVAALQPILYASSQLEEAAAAVAGGDNNLSLNGGGDDGGADVRPLVSAPKDKIAGLLRAVLHPHFARYDVDSSQTLEVKELARVFDDMNEPKTQDELAHIFRDYDVDASGSLSFDEFVDGMKQYVLARSRTERASVAVDREEWMRRIRQHVEGEEAGGKEEEEDEDEEEEIPDEFAQNKFKTIEEQQAAIKRSALSRCFLGTVIVLVFSDPITDVLTEIGARTGINGFYVAFVVAPLITNGSEVLASYSFALKKTQKSMVVAYEQLLGAAIMNNTYCLLIFLVLIYSQNLYWDYTAEVMTILTAEVLMFAVATSSTVYTMRTALAVLAIYPAAILLVWLLENVVGVDR